MEFGLNPIYSLREIHFSSIFHLFLHSDPAEIKTIRAMHSNCLYGIVFKRLTDHRTDFHNKMKKSSIKWNSKTFSSWMHSRIKWHPDFCCFFRLVRIRTYYLHTKYDYFSKSTEKRTFRWRINAENCIQTICRSFSTRFFFRSFLSSNFDDKMFVIYGIWSMHVTECHSNDMNFIVSMDEKNVRQENELKS